LFSARPDAKGAIRDRVRQRRRLISPADRGAAAAAVVAVVAESGLLPVTPGIVAGYWPVGSELDCRPLLHGLDAAGWGCVLPVVVGATLALRFRSWRPGQPLETGGWRIPEPAASAPDIIPTVVLVPMVAFDRAGHRLGQGGGHYDRTLAALRSRGSVLAVGLAFAVQEEPALPAEPHDQPLDWLVTENGALRVGRA
jgi:5-formyltetrahydrofolate cyclo-ligase